MFIDFKEKIKHFEKAITLHKINLHFYCIDVDTPIIKKKQVK